MDALTEESLNKLIKPDLLALVVSLQSKINSVNSYSVNEFYKMREGFDQIKSDLSVTKRVNTLTSERLQTIEKQYWTNAQYSRRVPRNLLHSFISWWKISQGCCLQSYNKVWRWRAWKTVTELAKGLRSSLNFVKTNFEVLKVRKNLTKLPMEDFQLTSQNKLYF